MSLIEKYKKKDEENPQNPIEKPELFSYFLQEKPSMILEVVYQSEEETITSDIGRIVDTTYAHAVKQIQRMEDDELLEREKKGRRKIVTLTSKGEKVAEKLIELDETLEEVSEV